MRCETHSWLPGYTGGDDDNVSTFQCLAEAVIGREVAFYFGRGVDMRQICSDAWCVDNIVQTQLSLYLQNLVRTLQLPERTNLGNERADLQQQRQWLANTAYSRPFVRKK